MTYLVSYLECRLHGGRIFVLFAHFCIPNTWSSARHIVGTQSVFVAWTNEWMELPEGPGPGLSWSFLFLHHPERCLPQNKLPVNVGGGYGWGGRGRGGVTGGGDWISSGRASLGWTPSQGTLDFLGDTLLLGDGLTSLWWGHTQTAAWVRSKKGGSWVEGMEEKG